MTTEREAGSEGTKLSAEVKPFVPKYAGVTVAWAEPSEACVFPRYYATCYPYAQEPTVDKQQVYTQDVPWDTTTSLNQNLLRCSSLGEYTGSPYSLDAAPKRYAVPGFQHDDNNAKLCSFPRQDKGYSKQTSPIGNEARNSVRVSNDGTRQPKGDESKWECKRSNGSNSCSRTMETSFQAVLPGRNPIKSDRPIQAVSRKFKQVPNAESLPVPAFEITLSDFPELQSVGNNNLPDLQKRPRGPLGEGDKLLPKPPEKPENSPLITKEAEVILKKPLPAKALSSSSDPGVPQVPDAQVSWATVLSQTSKKVVLSSSTMLVSRHSGNKGKGVISKDPEHSQSREVATDNELEETSEKKKKRKKKKKAKSNSGTEPFQRGSILVQEPPRIEDAEEFPDLAAATDKKSKPGPSKISCPTTDIREQTEVTREAGFASHNSRPQNERITSKPDVISGRKTIRQTSSSTTEKWKMQEPHKSSGKKSQAPVQLDLGGMLAALEQKQHAEKSKQSSKPVVLSVGGAVTLPSKESTAIAKSHHLLNLAKTPHNPLDSSAPLVKKGKQREVPKAKKPTSLKKIILKEREQRKQQHLDEQTVMPTATDTVLHCAEVVSEDLTPSQDTKAEIVRDASVDPASVAQGSSEAPLEPADFGGSTESSPAPTKPNSNLPKIHSRRFRDYCTQVLSKEVDSCVTDLLKELVRFQDRLYQKDPVKAKTKRRLVMGLREVLKHLKLKKLRCVIISPNCEKIQSKGGLDETLHLIIDAACEQNIPFVFALNRKTLGRCVNKAVPVSVVGIFSYDGAQDYFHKMVELTMEARVAYKEMIATLERESAEEENKSDCVPIKAHSQESNQQDTDKTPPLESDEDVPNYIKIWKRKLEEEYNPYVLELEKQTATEMLTLDFEEPQ